MKKIDEVESNKEKKPSKVIEESSQTDEMWKRWRKRIFITVWATYMIYYIGRVNIGIAKPFMMDELGISPEIFGSIGMGFFFAYAFGQFFNGFLGDKIGARRLMAVGLVVSALINIIIGAVGGVIWLFALVWGLNGFFQSMGWGPSVKTIANWYPPKERGKWSGRLGTSYMVGGAFAWLLAMLIIINLEWNWRWSFFIPGIIMLVFGIHYYIRVRNAPEEVGLPTIEEESEGKTEITEIRKDDHLGFNYSIGSILKNKTVWFAAFGLFCLNMVRYGITEWLPFLMAEEVVESNFFPLWKTIAFPIGGTIGALSTTWFSDRFLKKRRMPIISVMFLLLALSIYLYTIIPPLDWVFGVPLLVLIGFLTFGPHVLLVSTIPMEFGMRKAASSATGFIDGWGYIGAAITAQLSGILIGVGGPEDALYFWIIAALAGGLVLLLNWKSVPKKKEFY